MDDIEDYFTTYKAVGSKYSNPINIPKLNTIDYTPYFKTSSTTYTEQGSEPTSSSWFQSYEGFESPETHTVSSDDVSNLSFKEMMDRYGEGVFKVTNWNLRDQNSRVGVQNSKHKQAHPTWKNEDGSAQPMAFDLTPTKGHTFDDIFRVLGKPEWTKWLAAQKQHTGTSWGILDETSMNKIKQLRTNGTAPHIHLGADSAGWKHYARAMKKYNNLNLSEDADTYLSSLVEQSSTRMAKKGMKLDTLKEEIIKDFPIFKKLQFNIQEDPEFAVKWKNGPTSYIEYISAEYPEVHYDRSSDFESGTPYIKSATPGIGTIYVNSKALGDVTKDAIKLDLLHALDEQDDMFQYLQDKVINTIDWNDKDALRTLGDYSENNPDGEKVNKHNTVAGILRNLLVSKKNVDKLHYDDPEKIYKRFFKTDSQKQALQNLMDYMTSETLPEVVITPKSHKEGGVMEIIVEKKEEKKDQIQCLLCTILNALGLGKEEFKRHKDPTSLLGGNMEIVIQLGGPKEAYKEDSLEKMFQEIFPMIDTKEEYSESDVKRIRREKASYGEAVKKLFSLMDDKKIVKAFNGMQMLKKGGSVKSSNLTPKSTVRETVSGDLIRLPDTIDADQQAGRKAIETSKGTVYAQGDGRVVYAKYVDPRIKSSAEGGQVEEISTVKATIGKKEYTLYEAKTEEEKEKGLMGVEKLADNEGMIFYYDEPQDLSFWMKDTFIPLTICFFNEDEECISVKQGHPLDNTPISEKDVMFVVELNANADVVPGDILDLPGDDDEYVMQVLGSNGQVQYNLKGGERIVSRRETKILLKKAKRAYKAKNDETYDAKCRALGKYIFKVLDGQDNRDPEYVNLDSKKD